MEHNYIEDLLFFKKNAVENIISTANWDIENYFEMKDEAAEDEDIDFEENGDCEEYGRDYRFDEDEVEDAINFLFYYEECTIREIAQVLEVSQGTVKSRLSRAREKLKQMLREEGDCSEQGVG